MGKHIDILTKLYKQYLKQRPYKATLGQDITYTKQPSSKIIKRMIKLYWVGISDFKVDGRLFNLILEYMEKTEYVSNRDKYLNDFNEAIMRRWVKRGA